MLALLCALLVTPVVQLNAMGLVHSNVLLLLLASPGLFLVGLIGLKLGTLSLIVSFVINFFYYSGVFFAVGALLRSRHE